MFVRHVYVVFLCLIAIDEISCQKKDCFTPDGLKGQCIQITECPLIYNMLINSPRPLPREVVNTLNSYTCSVENRKPKVCCKDSIISTDGSDISRTDNEDVSNHRNINLLPLDNCGDILEGKISNGNITSLFELPWMARLRYNERGNLHFLCGGSLISKRYVLTAAHCVTKLKSTMKLVDVRLGEHDTRTDIDCEIIGKQKICAPPVQDIPVEEILPHPLYGKLPQFSNDIALLRLARPANTALESVRPICLPTTPLARNAKLRRVSIAGWGTTENHRNSPVLLQAILPIVPNDICQRKLQMVKHSIQINEHQMCAGGEQGIDGCEGDSGGPLIFPANVNGVRMVQFGVVSFGVSGCSGRHTNPGVYSKVAAYMPWILDQMRS